MNKLFLVLMLAVMALGLTACLPEEETPEYIPPYVEPGNTDPVDEEPVEETPVDETPVDETPVEPGDEEPTTDPETPTDPEEPVLPTDPETTDPETTDPTPEVITDKTVKYDKELTKDVWETINLDVTGYKTITITLQGKPDANPTYDIPVNINNFKVDGNEVTYTGVTGTSYLSDKEFNIGELNAVGSLINTHKDAAGVTSLRLHTYHKDLGTTHFITINVEDINTFEFQYKITTNSFAYLGAIVIDFIV